MFEDILKIVCKVLSDQADKEAKPEDTLADLGFDSMDVLEAMLNLEQVFPEANMDTYDPATTTTVREIATKIDWLKVAK